MITTAAETECYWKVGEALPLSLSLSPDLALLLMFIPPLPPLCDARLCTRVYACWRTMRAPGCPCVCLLVLRTEVMWEQQPCDSSAGCQSLEAFPLGCLQNRINMQYLAALVTETCPAHTNKLKKCWSIFERVESITNRDQLKSLVKVKNKQNNRNRRSRATTYELTVCIKRIFFEDALNLIMSTGTSITFCVCGAVKSEYNILLIKDI